MARDVCFADKVVWVEKLVVSLEVTQTGMTMARQLLFGDDWQRQEEQFAVLLRTVGGLRAAKTFLEGSLAP